MGGKFIRGSMNHGWQSKAVTTFKMGVPSIVIERETGIESVKNHETFLFGH